MINTPVDSVLEYLNNVSEDKKLSFEKLRNILCKNIPSGFEETINYGMITYVVPHTLYPKGYHCDPKIPLPFVSIAAQKNFISLYHMGIYADENLLNWFKDEHLKSNVGKLDMGKSCIRFKKEKNIPYDLITELIQKISATQWVELYESKFLKK